jgi:TolA-binding protein
MSDTEEEITVGAVSADGEGRVDLPVVELLTGRGFVTGKSGSGKSNTASVVAEKLLDRGLSLLIVDIDGEYYGLKEEYEILHVGADEECDIQVSPEHAGKIAELALEQHVPIILDVSSFLDEREAKELLTEVARQLFAKEKKKKQPFLLVVEEIHEWLPEGGGLDECGRMLIKVAKRGRKHGLGMCGISQRPADVKKDFITQCDWLVWHRLTWGNDTKVVQRILGSDYADWVEDLNDGEGFLMTDWDEEVRQVQFQRKRTFDAGATPGLDDFERPELKSVSGDLVSDLEEITEEKQARQNRIRELERELKDRDLRIEELEEELEEARDLSNMAEQFARAMMAHATGRAFREDITGYQAELEEDRWQPPGATTTNGHSEPETEGDTEEDETPPEDVARPWPEFDGEMSTDDVATGPSDSWDAVEDEASSTGTLAEEQAGGSQSEESPDKAGASDDGDEEFVTAPSAPDRNPDHDPDPEPDAAASNGPGFDDILVPGDESKLSGDGPETGLEAPATQTPIIDADASTPGDDETSEAGGEPPGSDTPDHDPRASEAPDATVEDSEGFLPVDDGPETSGETSGDDWEEPEPYERPIVASLSERIAEMGPVTRGMLAYYRERGPASPLDAHVAAGGDGDRPTAYGRNRELREAGLVAHAGRGTYGYALPSLLDEAHDGRLSEEALAAAVERVEETFRERADAPWPTV